MSRTFSVYINDQLAFEYDREVELDEQQLAFLDMMDGDMDQAIKIRGELHRNPDLEQRGLFMAMNLIKALQQDDNAKITASCAYLGQRRPALLEIRASDEEGSVVIELVDDEH